MSRRFGAVASALVLLGSLVAFVANAPAASASTTGSISGSVAAAGNGPLSGVCVYAESLDSGVITSAVTALDGTYTVSNLAADEYVIQFDPTCNGTVSSSYATQFYPDSADFYGSTGLDLGIGANEVGVDATLLDGATIGGVVTAGGGIPNVCVSAISALHGDVIATAVTGSGGVYSITNLPATTYTVGFDPTCDYSQMSSYATQFFGNKPDISVASTFSLAIGGSQTAVDAGLATGSSISGLVIATAGVNSGDVCVLAISDTGSTDTDYYVGLAVTASNGTYTITNLPADTYTVEFDPSCLGLWTTGFATVWWGEATGIGTAEAFVLGAGGAASAIDQTLSLAVTPLAISPGGLSSGTVSSSYSATVGASGGTGPYVWVASGLPAGLTMDAATGSITGTPAVSGDFTVSVTVTDASTPAIAATSSFSLTVAPAAPPPATPAVTPATSPPRTKIVCSDKTKRVTTDKIEIKNGKKIRVVVHETVRVYKTVTIKTIERIHGKKVVVVTHKSEPVRVCRTVKVG